MFRSKKLGAIVEAIDTMWDLQADTSGRVLELEKRIAKLEKKMGSNDTIVKGVVRKIMDMENKLCVCKPNPKLVKEKEAFIEGIKSKWEKAYEEKPVKRGRGRPRKIKVEKK